MQHNALLIWVGVYQGRSKEKIDGAIAMVLMLDRITAPEPLDDEPEVAINL